MYLYFHRIYYKWYQIYIYTEGSFDKIFFIETFYI